MTDGVVNSADDVERIFTHDGISEMLVQLLNGWRDDRGDGRGFSSRCR